MDTKKEKLLPLFFPIFFEVLLLMLTGVVDTLMLSSEGDQAVGAVGTANSYISLFLILFSVISSGMIAVMTQYIGANRPDVAHKTLRLGLLVNLTTGIIISGVLFFAAEWILRTVGIAQDLLEPACIYLQTVGLFSICSSIIPIYSSYLRSIGHADATLSGTIISNLINIGLNALFLFGMDMGVFGVALATGISKLINLLWVWIVSHRHTEHVTECTDISNHEILAKIIRVGLPAAMETSLYNLAIAMVISLLNQMDSTGFQATARAYTVQITNFGFCASYALSQANAILVGWRIGAKDFQKCDQDTRKHAMWGIVLGVGTASLFAIFSKPILSLFTNDPEMIDLIGKIFFINIFLELGRGLNLVFGYALKTSGDATYPMVIAIVFSFLFAVGGTWYFGIHLQLLAVGAYIGMALDECVRALFMFLRWCSGYWKKNNLLSKS